MDWEICTYPDDCPGCREVCGKPFWTEFAKISVCPIYDCCANERGRNTCKNCPEVPCERYFANPDPSMCEEEARKTLERNMGHLIRSV